jgi:hypothetical protein
MKDLVDWVFARRYVVVALAVLLAPSVSFASAGVIAAQTAYRGVVVGIGDVLVAALAVALVTLASGGSPAQTVNGCIALVAGFVVGSVSRTLRGFNLTVQCLLVFAYVVVLLYTLFGSVDTVLFDALMQNMQDVMRDLGATAVQLDALAARQPQLVGFIAVSALMDLMLVTVITFWLIGIARGDNDFAKQFREMRLGYVLGVPSILILIGALAFDGTLIHNLCGVAACGILLQALALFHDTAHARKWHPIAYVPVYGIGLPFGITLTMMEVLGLYAN